jgi:hypothetical protein
LAGLTALQHLELKNMQLQGRDALALCACGLSHLTRMTELRLRGNQLDDVSRAILAATARALPQLSRVAILDDDAQPVEAAARTALLQKLDGLAGRTVFE